MAFDFDPALSASQNIDKFHAYLETVDKELATLLKIHLPAVVPVSENANQRRTVRAAFNGQIAAFLDLPKGGAGK